MKYKTKIPVDGFYVTDSIRKYCYDKFGPAKIKGRKHNRNVWSLESIYSEYAVIVSFRKEENLLMFLLGWS